MATNEYDYDVADLIGSVTVPRLTFPTIRSSIRRSDADGVSTVPYYPGINTKKLDIEYTDNALAVQSVSLTIAGNSYADLIDDIKALDPTNLEAIDMGGFLGIRNTNGGDFHYIKILPQGTPADEAAALLGFAVDPMPGSISYAGELASSPGHRVQQNPQGTALIAKGEDLSGDALNRALVSLLRSVDKLRSDLERDCIHYVDVPVTVQAHEISTGVRGFYLNDPTIRLPIRNIDPSTSFGFMEGFVTLYDTTLKQEVFNGTNKVQALRIHHADATTALNTGNGFATWDTPDGGHIYDATIPVKEKHVAVTITDIVGNVLYCPGATFETSLVQKNDPVLISGATNTSPYSHNGWFAVLEVLDEEHLRLRPMGTGENIPAVGPTEAPFALNPTSSGFGDVEVYFGDFVPARKMFVSLQNAAGFTGSYIARIACGKPVREAVVSSPFSHSLDPSAPLTAHVTDPTDAHASTAITGFTSATTWADASTISGATLKATIEDILTDLATTSGNGGANRVGTNQLSSVGFTVPKVINAGTVRSQLEAILGIAHLHETDSRFHPANGWITGLGLGVYSFPNMPINGGTIVAEYLGQVRVFTVTGTSFPLSAPQTFFFYIDLADNTIKSTTTVATAFSATTFPLYEIRTTGFGTAWIHDFRVPLASSYSRNKGVVTVGPAGADFDQIESAYAWITYRRSGLGDTARTWEIVVQGNVTMSNSIYVGFPITIRGAAKDASGTPLCKVTTTPGGVQDQTVAFVATSGVNDVVFKDLIFEVSSANGANATSQVIGHAFGHETGNGWVIDNCIFSGGTNSPYIEVTPNTVTARGWIIRDCWFKAATRTLSTPHILLDEVQDFLIKGCKFDGQTADALQMGIRITGSTSVDNTIDTCWFDMGGRHIFVEGSTDRTVVKDCRFKNSRAATVHTTSTGELSLVGCWYTNCMTNSSTSEAVIWSGDSVSNRIYVRSCRFISWVTGYAIRSLGNAGKNSRVVDCVFTSTAPDRCVIGFDNALFMGNDFDLSPGAASGSGKDIANVLSVGSNCRIIGNSFRNCGSNASASSDTVISFSDHCNITGNNFVNCRGKMIECSGSDGDSVIAGNVCEDCGTGEFDRGFDSAGSTRNFVYGNNFQNLTSASQLEMRPLFKMHQNWCAPMYAAWTTAEIGAGTVAAVLNDAATRPGMWLRLRCTEGATDVAAKYSEGILKGPLAAEIAVAVEFFLDVPGIYGTGNDFYFHVGFCHDEAAGGVSSTDDAIKIIKTDASTNFIFRTGGSANTDTDTGVNANTGYWFRIEVLGSSEPGGAKAMLWINDVLRATHTTNLPDDQAMPFSVALVNTGEASAGNYDVYISPITIEYRLVNYQQ